MTYPNRELSQFASFLTINDFDKKIGITSDTLINVGIGTTVPEAKLHVNGNIKANGIVSANQYYGDGSTLSNVTAVVVGSFVSNSLGIWTGSNIGVGTTNITDKLTVRGNVGVSSVLTAYRVVITAPNGISPFSVSSTNLVTNLNADYIRGRIPPSGNFVGDSDTQTLTNKTLTNPSINNIVNGAAELGIPLTSGTLIHTGAIGIITSGLYASGSITNSHISNSAAISYNKLNLNNSILNSDINSNAAITYSKLNLTNSIVWSDFEPTVRSALEAAAEGPQSFATLTRGNYLTGTDYNGSAPTTWSVDASTSNVAGTIVARDSGGVVNATSFIGNGTIPVGGIIAWYGTLDPNTVPNGWALCDGRTVNGILTPDLRGRFILGAGGTTVGYSPQVFVGSTGGSRDSIVVSHGHGTTVSSVDDHWHLMFHTSTTSSLIDSVDDFVARRRNDNINGDYQMSQTPSTANVGRTSGAGGHNHTVTVNNTGSSGTNANMPPYYALAWIIRVA
jgi:microcystin-dependent protein